MPIKDITAPVAKAKKTSKEMPSVVIDATTNVVDASGNVHTCQLLTEFNKARAAFKQAEAQMKELEPQVKKLGVREWIKMNVDNSPAEPITSIKMVDSNGSETRLTGMDKYPICDAEPVAAVFEEQFGKDVNQYVQFTLKASFNSKVFLNADGDFDQRIYEAFKAAIDATAKKLNVPSPLEATKVLQPKPGFHKDRWTEFNVIQQTQIHEVLPCTVTLTPLLTNEPSAPLAEPPTA